MKPFTVLVINSALGFETVEEYAAYFRLPVSAFYEMTAPDAGHGTASVEPSQVEHVSDTLYDLYQMVKSELPPDASEDTPGEKNWDALRAWSRDQLAELRRRLDVADQALADEDDDALFGSLESIRETAEGLAFAAYSVDSVSG